MKISKEPMEILAIQKSGVFSKKKKNTKYKRVVSGAILLISVTQLKLSFDPNRSIKVTFLTSQIFFRVNYTETLIF
jgi:hypothetical protein